MITVQPEQNEPVKYQPNNESIEAIRAVAQKYDLETEVIYQDEPCPVVDFYKSVVRKSHA